MQSRQKQPQQQRYAPLSQFASSTTAISQPRQSHRQGGPARDALLSSTPSSPSVLPGVESRPLQANPEFFKNSSLARSRNSVAPLSSAGPSSVAASADVSVTSQHLAQFQRGGYQHLSNAHLSDRVSNNNYNNGGLDGRTSSSSRYSNNMCDVQRRLMNSRGSNSSNGSSPSGGKRGGGSAQFSGPAASAVALRRNGPKNSTGAPKPVNYNELMRRSEQQQQQLDCDRSESPPQNAKQMPLPSSSAYPPSDPRSRLLAYQQQEQPPSSGAASPPPRTTSSSIHENVTHRDDNGNRGGVGAGAGGFMEGPLPSEVRGIIEAHFRDRLLLASAAVGGASGGSGSADVEEAERQARRLLSTSRRVKVYKDELHAANDEVNDLTSVVHQHSLVASVLQTELTDIDARIAQLMQERQLCAAQLKQQMEATHKQEGKLSEARERVAVLKNTIENITTEAQAGQTVLRQLVPGLNIENYV